MRFVPSAAACLALLLAGAPAGAAPGADLLDRVQERFDTLHDLRADFVQVLHSGVLGSDEPESGTLVAARPGRMLWEYRTPSPRVAGVGHGWGWLYDPELEELECYPLEDLTRDDVVGSLLTGRIDLRESFEVEVLEEAEAGGVTLLLRPRRLSEEFEELRLTLRRSDLVLEALVVVDPVGNRLEYLFSEQRLNGGVADSDFRHPLPPGTRKGEPCLHMPEGSGP
jgi:outer membrane lipoprotein-sorting protein